MSPYDQALNDFYFLKKSKELTLHNNYGEPEVMPIEVFFREQITELDEYALSLCHGKILDIGAGVGVHSLLLQQLNKDVSSLEISEKACQIMKQRGVQKIFCESLYDHNNKYDTLLILMNGFGLAGNINTVSMFLQHLKSLLKPGGKILVDSSDVSYMFKSKPKDRYYGEVKFCYEYDHILGEWFDWLYIDQSYLKELAELNGFQCQIVFEDGQDQYLAVLRPISN